MTDKTKMIAFKADDEDLQRIDFIKSKFEVKGMTTTLALKLALKVYADALEQEERSETDAS